MKYEEATARCWAEIDLDEVCGNYERAKEIVGEGTEVICVLKGNAYGLGAKAVCQALMEEGAKRFAVASGDEAEELLESCPGAEVLVLGLTGEDQAKRLIEKRGMFTLFGKEQGEMLARAGKEVNLPVRVHVKIDTGLYRLGFSGAHAADEIMALYNTGRFMMEGLFTHLALHNRPSDEKQLQCLKEIQEELSQRGLHFPMIHALDSIGMVRYPEARMDAVRTGAWLYGVTPNRSEHPELCHPTAKFKARVAQIHAVKKGEMIGYDDDHPLNRDSLIATLTAGYLDGVPRLNNVGEVVIRGKRAKVVGLVCMDQMMVDVTDIPGVQPGDEATFLGDGITINEYAAWGRLNRNEALGRFSRRTMRVYHWKGKTFCRSDFEK